MYTQEIFSPAWIGYTSHIRWIVVTKLDEMAIVTKALFVVRKTSLRSRVEEIIAVAVTLGFPRHVQVQGLPPRTHVEVGKADAATLEADRAGCARQLLAVGPCRYRVQHQPIPRRA